MLAIKANRGGDEGKAKGMIMRRRMRKREDITPLISLFRWEKVKQGTISCEMKEAVLETGGRRSGRV